MDRYWEANSATTTPSAPASTQGGYPTDGNLAAAIPPTTPGAWWYHCITEEIRNAIATLGGKPDWTQTDQLAKAIAAAITNAGQSITATLAKVATSGSYTDLINKPAIQPPLGFTAVQQGTGVGQLSNAVKIGWDGAGLRATVDAADQGHFVFESELASDVNSLQNQINGKQASGNFVTAADSHGYALGWSGVRPQLYVDGKGQGDIFTANWFQPMTLGGLGNFVLVEQGETGQPGTLVAGVHPGGVALPGTWMSCGGGQTSNNNWYMWVRVA